jgi:hypothetical protein
MEDLAGERMVPRQHLPRARGRAWTGAPGRHDYVLREGPALTAIALDFLRAPGRLPAARTR